MKKKILIAISYVLILALGIAGTVAYFTDRDAEVNVFTVGDVQIELNNEFKQGTELMPGKTIENEVSITNTGKNDAWVWLTVDAGEIPDDALTINGIAGDWSKGTEGVVKYAKKLAPGATTPIAIGSIAFSSKVDAAPNGDLYLVENGTPTPLNWNVKTNAYPAIYVNAYAIQADQFANVDDAILAYKGQWGTLNGEKATVVDSAAELKAAIAEGGSVVLATDLDVTDDPFVINNDTVLNLNGNTITGKSTNSGASNLFQVKAGKSLTLMNGTVSFTAGKPDTDWGDGASKPYPGYASNTIKNEGKVIVDGATLINNTGKGGASYVVDCYQGSELIVNSGVIKQAGGDVAIRTFANSATLPINVTINDGEITGNRAVWIQLPSSNASIAPTVNLTVNGGTLISTNSANKDAIYSYSFGNDAKNVTVTLNGGTYYGDVALGAGEKINPETLIIDADKCTFYGEVMSYNPAASVPSVTPDGAYAVAADKNAVQDALQNAVASGATDVVVNANGAEMDMNYGLDASTVPAGTTVTIQNAVVNAKSYGNAVAGKVIFDGCTFENPNGAYSIHFDAGSGDVVFNNCTLSGWCSFGSAIKSVELNNCTIKGNGKYAMCRFYQDTVMNNCVIDCSNTVTDDIYVDGISAVIGSTVSLKNCEIVKCTYEVAEGGKIVVDGTTVAED